MPIQIFGIAYYGEAETAQLLGCSAITVRRIRTKRQIAYQRLPGRRGAFYSESQIQEFLASLRTQRKEMLITKSASAMDNTAKVAEQFSKGNEPRSMLPMKRGKAYQVTLEDLRRATSWRARHDSDK